MRKHRHADQGDLFRPEPMISGKTNVAGRDVWYDRRRMNWTLDPSEMLMSDEELRAHRAQQVADFDAALEAWK